MPEVLSERERFDRSWLSRAAAGIRARAEQARTSSGGRWYLRTPAGGYPQNIADDASAILVADTCTGPQVPPHIARHILSWDPEAGRLVASLLAAISYALERGECPAVIRGPAVELAAGWLRERGEDERRESLDEA